MSDVPDGWEKKSFGDCSSIITKGTTPTTGDFGGYTHHGVNFIRVENITSNGDLSTMDMRHISSETHDRLNRSQLKKDDLLFSIAGALGRCASVTDSILPSNINQAIAIIRPLPSKINVKYVRFAAMSSNLQQTIISIKSGNAQSNLNLKQVSELSFPLPPLAEQKKIAAILSSVDRCIEKTEAMIAKLQDLKKAMMQELLTTGLPPDVAAKHGIKKSGKFKDSPLGLVPVEWKVVAVTELLFSMKSGLSRKIVAEDIGIPVLISGNIQDGKLDANALRYWYQEDPQGATVDNYLLDDGDILICFINSISQIGKLCIYRDIGRPTIYTTNLFRIITKGCDNSYVYYMMNTNYFQSEINMITKPAVNQASFTKEDFLKIKVVRPSLSEQCAISSVLIAEDMKIEKSRRRLSRLQSLKNGLMQDLLTGRVRVTTGDDA